MKTIALVCTHNGERHLEDQVRSILGQTNSLDLIIIDDYNSTDRTLEIVERLAAVNSNVRFNSYNYAKGPSHSFLNSVKAVVSEFDEEYLLYLVDQDDVWLPNKNEKVLSEYNNRGSDIIFHDVAIVDEVLMVLRNSYYGKYWRVARDLTMPSQLFANCVIGHTCALSGEFLKTINIEYDERIPMHDWFFVNEALFSKGNIFFIDEVLSLYRQHSNNILGASRKKNISLYRALIRHSVKVRNYHDFLTERYPKEIAEFKINSPIVILRNLRPFKKLLTILIVKNILFYDQIRFFRK